MRVLLIEDDSTIAAAVVMMLHSDGAVTDVASTGDEGLELCRHYDYDVVVLDLMLPDMEGYEVVRRMRMGRISIPVLVLSGLSTAQAKVKALGAGADDYMTKPFDRSELLARVHALVRRSKGFSHPVLHVRNLDLDQDSHTVEVAGRQVRLTAKEYAILELMVMRRGMVLDKGAFLSHLYGGIDEPDAKIIDVFICKLRKKLADAGAGNLIETVWGRGYLIRRSGSGPVPSLAGTAVDSLQTEFAAAAA
jgi:two-component system, cell cycle response regulator CtrA